MNSLKATTLALTVLLTATAMTGAQADSVGTSALINNLVPVVDSIGVASSVSPSAGTTVVVPITLSVRDNNGFQDLSDVRVTLKSPGGAVHTATASATSAGDGSGTSEGYTHNFTLQYYDDPGTYTVEAVAQDQTSAVSVVTLGTFSYEALAALDLDTSSVAFGSIDPGVDSSVKTVTVENFGNVLIDLQTEGSSLSDGVGHDIDVSRIKYDLANSNMSASSALTSTAFTNGGFNLAYGPAQTSTTYWQLDTPSGDEQYLPAGTYSGTITLAAVTSA